jgi:small subunit ribosomal protein YMR-31
MLPGPQPQQPHPAAPAQVKEAFSDFLKKYKSFSFPSESSEGHSQQKLRFNEFWEAPEYLWRPKISQLEDSEIDAVLVSLLPLVFL